MSHSSRSSFTLSHDVAQDVGSTSPPDPRAIPTSQPMSLDIEHMPVNDDPRKWSSLRKNISLFLVSSASMISGLAGNIQNPAVEQMEIDLPATSAQFSLSISIFILVQGLMPLFWSAITEIKGRKVVYLVSLALFSVGSIVVAVSENIELVIGFRSLQAAGSSAIMTIGAATLADIYEPAERGTKIGIYYCAPLLGPAIGPILGGVLTTGLSWRAIFWFLAIVSGTICLKFLLFFHDTFRRERSAIYQNILEKRIRRAKAHPALDPATKRSPEVNPKADDLEKSTTSEDAQPMIKLTLRDVNPFKPVILVLRRLNNVTVLFASGLLFAFAYFIAYTTARTLSSKYHYNALDIGLVLLAYGLGSIFGCVLGGRWSDRELARLKTANGNISYPEMRLKSAIYGVILLPPFVLAFGWVCEQQVHIAAMCAMLFCCGFFSIWTYSSTLAYIVDANNGHSSSAVATNSAFRGLSAFVATEIAVPLQDGLGDGWTYTIWAFLMLFGGLLILLVSWRGAVWRESAEKRDMKIANKHSLSDLKLVCQEQ